MLMLSPGRKPSVLVFSTILFFCLGAAIVNGGDVANGRDVTPEQWKKMYERRKAETDRKKDKPPDTPRVRIQAPLEVGYLPIPFFSVEDRPYDTGGKLLVRTEWRMGERLYNKNELANLEKLSDRVELWRAFGKNGKEPDSTEYKKIADVPTTNVKWQYLDSSGENDAYFFVRSFHHTRYRNSELVGPVKAQENIININTIF